MSSCSHGINWILDDINSSTCLVCMVEYLENDDTPLTCREKVFQEILEGIKLEPTKYFLILKQHLELMKHVLLVFIDIYQKLNDNSLQKIMCDTIEMFYQGFGDEILDAFAAHLVELCMLSSTYRNIMNMLFLLLDVFRSLPQTIDRFLVLENFITYIVSGLAYPDDQLRMALLSLCVNLSSRWIQCQESLRLFVDLPQKLIVLLQNSDLHQVIIGTLSLLGECGKSKDFVEWIGGNLVQSDSESGISKLFSSIKRVLLLRQDVLNLPAIQTISILLQHSNLIQPMLDSDLAELMYDILCGSTSDALISSAYTCIVILSGSEEYFRSCHAMYGLKSICKSLQHLLPGDAAPIISVGYEILKVLCDRQPNHIPLMQSLSSFDQVLQVISDGVMSSQPIVVGHTMAASCSLLKHLPHPFPSKDVLALLKCMERNIPDTIIGMCNSDTQCINEEILEIDGRILSHLFQFIQDCLRLYLEANSHYADDKVESVLEVLLSAFWKIWIPLLKSQDLLLSCPSLMENFFSCITVALGLKHASCQFLWGKLLSEDFVDISLRLKIRCQQEENFTTLLTAVVEFLLVIVAPFLAVFDCSDEDEMLRNGFQNLHGVTAEMFHYLGETVFSNGQIDKTTLSLQCAVLTVLALSAWQDTQSCPDKDFLSILIQHASLNSDFQGFPTFSMKCCIFVFAVCQKDVIHPELPSGLVSRLLEEEALHFHHPAILSVLLQSRCFEITKEIKLQTIFDWISCIEFSEFSSHSDSKHLIGLMLLNREVTHLVLDAVSSSIDQLHSNKLILLISAAIDESANDDSDNADTASFYSLICQRLPEIVNLDWDYVKAASPSVTLSQLNLLHVLLSKKVELDNDSRYQHRILRKMILLVVNGMKAPPEIVICNELLTALLDKINLMLSFSDNVDNYIVETAITLNHAEFLITLEQLLFSPIKSYNLNNVHYYVFNLIATLIRAENTHKTKSEHKITFKSDTLLHYIEGSYGQRFQCSVLILWSSLFDCKFNSSLFIIEPIVRPPGCFLTPYDDILAPLNRDIIIRLFFMVLNCSAKGFPSIREVSLRCALSLLQFTRQVSFDLFSELFGNPWLSFCLQWNDNVNSDATHLCHTIEALKESTTE